MAAKLQIPMGTEVLRVCQVCTADGVPAIYCEDVFEKRLIKCTYEEKDFETSIFSFLKEFCDITAYMDITQIRAVTVNEHVASMRNIPVGTPILNMEEVDYDIDGTIEVKLYILRS